MDTVTIETNSKTYPVYVSPGVINQVSSFIQEKFPSLTTIMVMTDETVAELYLDSMKSALSNFKVEFCIVPSGEKAKTFDVYYQSLSFALEKRLDRKSLLIAFGGGAIGDLGGFVASTFMRGIPFLQVPTTILAHDSAVGGKVAINHPLGKNMIGAFYQPEAVFYDLHFLRSLPLNERRSGFAEVIKHSLIHDPSFYEWLLNHVNSLEEFDGKSLQYALVKGIEIKNYFVSKDEKESGIRAYLNFGHTLGHAIEAEMGYGKWTHGESILIGMLFALQLSKNMTGLPFDIEPLRNWLTRLGYETEIPKALTAQHLIERMKQDKKSIGQKVNFVLLKEIGNPGLCEVSEAQLVKQLEYFQQ
ncbi:3-dehydroquinate synthase [Bacillus sp. DTU_2020_1000418_1_SI_GHA_SEK_038]|uniref:3-dehydroquinate synthase n=1 Tax=Bacillus sp. DTU_2020_1000418_1_SI_GHA_SEK_038 TaxID=3077585 RepID=UPI0028F14630|nr:3-dehydroquinate synthase [Bacillus sp. DTU_2020_1000418_1_SI_GHA_SEK_038]WNS74029.1 3-dehydroquinate synthase [Bacillus sp. DTU_2020_1000418_1_SI_GHA_SEK_038]